MIIQLKPKAILWGVIGLTTLINISCKDQTESNEIRKIIAQQMGKEITFPTKLRELRNSEFNSLDSLKKEIKNKIKIISIIDATCVKCIYNNMNKLDSLINNSFEPNTNLVKIFILNFPQQDSARFLSDLYPLISSNAYLLWDRDYSFERENDILTDKAGLRTFLLDRSNKITTIGSPLYYPKILEVYKEQVEKTLNEKTYN